MMLSPETLAELSLRLVYSAIAVYALAMLAYAAETAGRVTSKALVTAGPPVDADPSGRWYRIGAIGTSLTVTGFALSVGAVLTRGLAAQRVPWGNMYEFAMVGAVAAGAAYLTLLYRRPVRALGVWIVGIVLLVLGLAVTVLYTPVDALVPVLNSYWLVIHVAAAITGGGVFTVGAVATVLFLIKSRSEVAAEGFDNPRARRYATTLPSSKSLDQVAHAAHMFAFPIWTFAVIAGAIWAENAWGRYWGWDPKETWAFITWVFYAAYLHAQATAGWRGRKASWFALAGYAAFLFNFFGVNLWISGLHSYAGV